VIEPTDEMIRNIRWRIGGSGEAARSAAEAVLGIVERDYRVEPKPPWEREDACLCGADLGPPWDSVSHRKGTRGCREAP
jgi:hypothetical protein